VRRPGAVADAGVLAGITAAMGQGKNSAENPAFFGDLVPKGGSE